MSDTGIVTRQMLRAKVHRIRVTERQVQYVGSLTLDPELLAACDMLPYEQIDIYDVDNGNRFTTYLIEGTPGSGECCVNGAAARLVEIGDKLIICAFAAVKESHVRDHKPQVVLIGEGNKVLTVDDEEKAGTVVP